MTEDCIFCRIIKKEAPASIVYEDEHVVAFLSNYPVNEGHTLVVPKKHYINIFDTPEDEIAYLFSIAKKIALIVRATFGAEGIRIVQNSERAADQVIFHIHVHVIPMYKKNESNHDGAFHDKTKPRSRLELDADAQMIHEHLEKSEVNVAGK